MSMITGRECDHCRGVFRITTCNPAVLDACKDCKDNLAGGNPPVCPNDGSIRPVFTGVIYTICDRSAGTLHCPSVGNWDCWREYACTSNAVVPNLKCATNKMCQTPQQGATCRECTRGAAQGDWNKVAVETCN